MSLCVELHPDEIPKRKRVCALRHHNLLNVLGRTDVRERALQARSGTVPGVHLVPPGASLRRVRFTVFSGECTLRRLQTTSARLHLVPFAPASCLIRGVRWLFN